MTYALDGFADSELDGFDLEDFEGDGFGDPFATDAPAGGALARIDAETAAMMMDVAAELAAEADSEQEADAFLPIIAKLAPMALKALAPLAKSAFAKIAPQMSRGTLSAGRKMLQRFGQKGMAAMPDIVRGVARDSLQRVADGQNVTGEMVMRSAAQHTLPFLQDPRQVQQAVRQHRWRLRQAQQHQPQYGPQPHGPPPYGRDPYGQQPYGQAPYGEPAYADGFPQEPPMQDPQLPQPNYPPRFM